MRGRTLFGYDQHLKLPGYKDKQIDRTAYITLLKELFDSGHQQGAAGQNAPGAKGIVEPRMILPADVKLGEDSNELNTFFARLNKPSDPDRKKMIASFIFSKKSIKRTIFQVSKRSNSRDRKPKGEKGWNLVS